MAVEPKQNLKQLKVDNWGVFFLQRLQLLYAKGDCCDLTLKFSGGQELKVHRLVLNTCTTYFEGSVGTKNVFELPESLSYGALHPIINFMYSGRLEFKPELHPILLSTAKTLKMDILIKLLHAQPKGESTTVVSTPKQTEIKKSSPVGTPTKIPTSLSSSNSSFNSILAGKKLPIWRKRNIPLLRTSESRIATVEEDPRPSRFEWPGEDASSILMTSPSFSSISYDSVPVLQSPASPPSPPPPPPLNPHLSLPPAQEKLLPPLKRPAPEGLFPPPGPPPEKAAKEADSGESHATEETTPVPSSPLPPADPESDDDDGHFETIHNYDESDDDIPAEQSPLATSHPIKPILKLSTDSTSTPSQPPSKKVRFSLGNEEPRPHGKLPPASPPNDDNPLDKGGGVSIGGGANANHAKIIAEVLKKFPELVKNNKNIRLKITTPSGGSIPKTTTLLIDSKVGNKSSYVVMKSSNSPDKGPPGPLPLPSPTVADKCQVEGRGGGSGGGAAPLVGPWVCKPCDVATGGLQAPFETFVSYRKHLQDVHSERLDTRICEYCGMKSSKRNLHLYHLYTKHNVPPPKNVKFPKCSQCNYIALSESLLLKHQNNHQNIRELTCPICNVFFKTLSSLQAHSVTCKPNNEMRHYSCKNCKKGFRTNVGLNAHEKCCQIKTEAEKQEEPTTTLAPPCVSEPMEMIEVPVLETVGIDKNQHALLQLPTGIILAESPNMTLLPSSESDGLTSVASGIATSIGLTVALPEDQAVILLDENSEFFLQGNNSVVVSNSHAVEEYIVPEILQDNTGRIYSTATSIPYTVSGTNVITAYPVMQVQSNKELHTIENIQPVPGNNQSFNRDPDDSSKSETLSSPDHSYSENIINESNHKAGNGDIIVTQLPEGLEEKKFELPIPGGGSRTQSQEMRPSLILHSIPSVSNQHEKESSNVSHTGSTEILPQVPVSKSEEVLKESLVVSNHSGCSKVKAIEGDWDLENEDEIGDITDDPELKPTRPTIDLQELP